MFRKRFLPLLLAAGLLFGMCPGASAAQGGDAESGLAELTRDDIEWTLTDGTQHGVDEDFLVNDDGSLVADGNDADIQYLAIYLTEDSDPGRAELKFTCPSELADEPDLTMRFYRFRPGDHVGDTIEGSFYEPLAEDGSYTLEILEKEGSWIYIIQYGTGSGEDFEPKSYRYCFQLKMSRYAWMRWEELDYEITSGELDSEYHWPSTSELFTAESGYDNYYALYLNADSENQPASAVFNLTSPIRLEGGQPVACIDGDETDLRELENRSFQVEVAEGSPVDMTVQFGIVNDEGEFVPRTYAHPLKLEILHLERMTWDDVECTAASGFSDRTHTNPGTDEPLRIFLQEEDVNWVNIYIVPENGNPPEASFTVTPPPSLADEDEIYVRYYSYDIDDWTGIWDVDSEAVIVPAADGYTLPLIEEGEDRIHSITFGVKDEDGNFIPKTYRYEFGIEIYVLSKLTWDQIEPILPEGAGMAAPVRRVPELGDDLYRPGHDSANRITVPVCDAPAGSKVRFKVTCPVDYENAIAQHLTFIKGLQNNPDAVFDEYELDEDGAFYIDVDLIGAADSTKVVHVIGFIDEDYNLITDYYHFDFVAKTDGVVINALAHVADQSVSAAVSDGSIANAIGANPEESTIYINAGSNIQNCTEAAVTIGSGDAGAIAESEVDVQIATPVATVTLPAEAIRQAQGGDEDARVVMKVEAVDSESVTYQNITVENAEKVEVTLIRITSDGTQTEVPIRMTGSKSVTVSVVTMQEPTLNKPVYIVYLPESGAPVLEGTATGKDSNSRITFSTSHLSEFALLSYDDVRRLGLLGGTASVVPPSGSSGGASHATRTDLTKKETKKETKQEVEAPKAGAVRLSTGRNGSVDFSPAKPDIGGRVTLTVTPDPGYQLDSIEVLDEGGKTVRLSEQSTNVYTFTMPSGDVSVETSFTSDGSVPEPVSTPAPSAAAYRDVASTDWFAESVSYVSANGWMAGNNGYFTPNNSLTRAMIAQILCNLEGASGAGGGRSFPDVAASEWYADAVSKAVSLGFMNGYGSGLFGPNDPITREQLASVFYSYAQAKGYRTAAAGELSGFADSGAVSDWAQASVRWAVGAGLLSGKSGGRLDPGGTASRAEVAQILMNFQRNIAG